MSKFKKKAREKEKDIETITDSRVC